MLEMVVFVPGSGSYEAYGNEVIGKFFKVPQKP
jgi:hypothetical protein